MNKKRILTLIFSTAFLLNLFLLVLYYSPSEKGLSGDEVRYITLAQKISTGSEIIASPIWPPGYEFFLSPSLFVAEKLNIIPPFIIAQLLQVFLWMICGMFFWLILSNVVPKYNVQILAFSLFILNPTVIAFSHYFWPEIPHLAIYLSALWLLMTKPTSIVWNCVVAILLSVASLLKLVYLPISIVLIVLIGVIRFIRKIPVFPVMIVPVLFVLILLPVLHHNYKNHGKVMIADSSVFNLWVGINDKELTEWHENAIVSHELNTYFNSAENHKIRNEILVLKLKKMIKTQGMANIVIQQFQKQYFRLFDSRSFFTKQLPTGMHAKYQFTNVWLANGLVFANSMIWALTLLGVGIGSVILMKKPLSWNHLFMGIIIYNLGIFLFLHVKTRYIIQFLPFLCIVSSYGLNAVWGRCNALKSGLRLTVTGNDMKLYLGFILSMVMLFLAFHHLWT